MLKHSEATKEESEAAGLIYRYYEPAGDSSQTARPLMLMLHGRAGDAKVMWTFSKALEGVKPVVVTPQAIFADEIGGWSWWRMTQMPDGSERGERKTHIVDLTHVFQRVEPFIEHVVEKFNIDRGKIFGAGFSQGGAVLSSLALKRPELFRGIAMLASFIPSVVFREPGVIADEVRDGRALLPEFFMAHGTRDTAISIEMAKEGKARLEQLGAEVEFYDDAVGHKVGADGMRAFKNWCERVMG